MGADEENGTVRQVDGGDMMKSQTRDAIIMIIIMAIAIPLAMFFAFLITDLIYERQRTQEVVNITDTY